jgi:hypothetical protein
MFFHHIAGYAQLFGNFGMSHILKLTQYKHGSAFGWQQVDCFGQLIKSLAARNNLFWINIIAGL